MKDYWFYDHELKDVYFFIDNRLFSQLSAFEYLTEVIGFNTKEAHDYIYNLDLKK